MSYVPWRSKQLSGGNHAPFDRASSRQAILQQAVAIQMRKLDSDPELLRRLLVRAQRIRTVIAAEGLRDPAVRDPRKTAKTNTGRVSKPDLPAAPRGGRVRGHQGTIG